MIVDDRPPFVGRRRELQQIANALAVTDLPNTDIVVVTGAPGAGKSALAEQFVREVHHAGTFFKILYVNLDGYAEDPARRIQPDEVFAPMLQSLAISIDENIVDPAVRAQFYHEVMNRLGVEGKSVLLWLDNASDQAQFDRLRTAHPLHKVVVTTRETFGHIPNRQVVEVGVLGRDEARELLDGALRDRHPGDGRLEANVAATNDLVEVCGGLPLALRIVAALLADEPERPVTALVSDLSQENRLNALHYSADLSVRSAVSLSYKRLRPDLQSLFRLLSVVPGRDVGLDAASWLVGASSSTVRSALMTLVRSSLVQQQVPDRWTMHDLVALCAAELCTPHHDAIEAEEAFRRVVESYHPKIEAASQWLATSVSIGAMKEWMSPQQAAAWFEAERPTLSAIAVNIVGRPEYRELALAFGVALADVLKSQHHYRIDDYYSVAAATASLVPNALNKKNALSALALYAGALCGRGEFLQAISVSKYALGMSEQIGDAAAAAAARSNIAVALQGMGQIDEAMKQYSDVVEQSLRARPRTLADEALALNNAAIALNNIGSALAAAERYQEAIPYLHHAILIRVKLRTVPGVASSVLQLGGVIQQLGSELNHPVILGQAIVLLEWALQVHHEHGNQSAEAYAAMHLGAALCELGRAEEGARYLEGALSFFEDCHQIRIAGRIRAKMAQHREKEDR